MQQELNAVKGALEQVVHTMEQWDRHHSATAPQGAATQGQNASSHAAQVSSGQQSSHTTAQGQIIRGRVSQWPTHY